MKLSADEIESLFKYDPREGNDPPVDDCDRRETERLTVKAANARRARRRVPLGSWAALNNAACNWGG